MPANAPAPKKKIFIKQKPKRKDKKRAALVRFMFTTLIATVMITTGGFGTFPPNGLTDSASRLISENFPAQIIQPANQVLTQISAPTLPVVEHPQSENANPVANAVAALIDPIFPAASGNIPPEAAAPEAALTEAFQTAVANALPTFDAKLTQTAEVDPTLTPAQSPSTVATQVTFTPLPSTTLQPTPSETPAPTWTALYIYPSPTIPKPRKTKAPPVPTSTGTPTPTATAIAAPTPAGHLINSLDLNSSGSNSAIVAGGSPVSLSYNYQIWGDSTTCPGCNFELVWGLDNAWQHCFMWASPSPGDFPGQTGAASTAGITFNITAPSTLGTYTIYSFSGQYPDCTSAEAAYNTGAAAAEGQITVSDIILYNYGSTTGNLGGRSLADAACAGSANRPLGYTSYRAFVSISDTDSIALMPTQYGVPTDLPIKSTNGTLLANNWADLLDGTINTDFVTAGVTSGNFWWSGSESDNGNAIPATSNCFNFSSNGVTEYGNIGNATLTGAGWMDSSNATCNNSNNLVCIAYP